MLQIYKVFRLVIIAVIITYFLGCFWFLYCTMFQNQLDENGNDKNDFINNFDLNVTIEIEEHQTVATPGLHDLSQLLISCYYVLTTLSTVGYGDYFPISNNERVLAIILMLGGVAFFSYIMGNFIEILSNYDKKMGVQDKSGDLTDWMLQLTRFTNNQPLNKQLMDDIEDNFRHYWDNDRLACMQTEDLYLEPLPRKIKNQIMTVYLFSDIFKEFKRFFSVGENANESGFLYDCAFGFMPREFDPENNEDKVIYDEEEEVIEMYFITEGIIGIGFSLISNGYLNKQHSIVKKLKGKNTIVCDHYVVNHAKSQFIYMALGAQNVKGYALSKKHLMENVFPHYPDIMAKIQAESFKIYKKQIFKPINESRNKELAKMNKKSTYR